MPHHFRHRPFSCAEPHRQRHERADGAARFMCRSHALGRQPISLNWCRTRNVCNQLRGFLPPPIHSPRASLLKLRAASVMYTFAHLPTDRSHFHHTTSLESLPMANLIEQTYSSYEMEWETLEEFLRDLFPDYNFRKKEVRTEPTKWISL